MKIQHNKLVIINIIAFLGFWIIAFLFYKGLTVNFDNSIYSAIAPFISDTNTSIMTFITNLGGTHALIVICVVLLVVPKLRKPFGIPITITVLSSSILNSLLKTLFSRERPNIMQLVDVDGFSFPSGHTMNNMALYTMLMLLLMSSSHSTISSETTTQLTDTKKDFKKDWRFLFILIMPLTISFSRIYLGVHYPSDVLAGLFAGFWVGSFVFLVYSQHKKNAR